MTTYVVLRYVELEVDPATQNARTYAIVNSSVEASNDTQAIKLATADLPDDQKAGTFVATPARSWTPRTRTVETKTVDRWS